MSRQFYDDFADALRSGDHEAARPYLERPGHAARLAVYCNNVASSAIEALRAAYPVVNALTGARFFSPMAKAFWQSGPPRTRSLTGYGSGFADFVDGYQPARTLPYLADIARLDRAWLEAHLAADASPCRPGQMAQLPPDRIAALNPGLHPSARLLCLAWPVHGIWQRHRSGRSEARRVTLAPKAQGVLVWRPFGDVRSVVLDPGSVRFIASLDEGQSLAEASEDALIQHAGFDPARAFEAALTGGYLSGDALP
ncbi:DNA-binding domain-containing protein [uncultured Maricaulis sp.]|uniref:HvfC/BufC N-terminal domain-containing protein n=1 Tax=uncultured Maricaulis sp. TaxID=174710 RepID=UPI00261AF9E7|nr:DNA-binding domain-containing protein [uncultured Maricaulis sp.]